MAETTTDPSDPRLGHSIDEKPCPQNEVYLVSEARSEGWVRPFRTSYRHKYCNTVTKMSDEIAETYAHDPSFYSATYCVECAMHRPVNEFEWLDGEIVGK